MCLRATRYLLHGMKLFHHVESMQWLTIIMNSTQQTLILGGSYGNVVGHIAVDSVFERWGLPVGEAFLRLYGEALFFWGEGSV